MYEGSKTANDLAASMIFTSYRKIDLRNDGTANKFVIDDNMPGESGSPV